MIQKHLLACGFWLWAASLYSQTPAPWIITGSIQNESRETLAGATVVGDEQCGTRTEKDGQFRLVCPARPQAITVRYPGYFARRIVLQPEDFQHNKAEKTILLTEQLSDLPGVTISAKPIEKIVEEDFTTDLYDYGFAGDRLLLLMREKKKWLLRLTTDRGEKLSEVRLPEQCVLLHRSCLGDYHVAGANYAWEIFVDGNTVDTMPRYSREQFRRFIEPCVTVADDVYFYKKYRMFNQELIYTTFREGEKPYELFRVRAGGGMDAARSTVIDFYTHKAFIYRTSAFNFRTSFYAPPPDEVDTRMTDPEALLGDAIHDSYDQLYRLTELELLRRDSVYAPLIKMGDTLCLFDHVNGQIIRFGPAVERSEIVPINYFEDKGWRKLLLHDEVSQRVYARFERKGGLILKEINPRTGEIVGTYDLSIAPYVAEKFRIRNGLLYFIGQPNLEVPNKMLYQMNIFAGKE